MLCRCSNCSSFAQLSRVGERQVLLIDNICPQRGDGEGHLLVEIPYFYCESCNTNCCVHPATLGYHPGLLDTGVNLEVKKADCVLWFNNRFLLEIAHLQHHCPDFSVDAIASTICELDNKGRLSKRTVAGQLGDALARFMAFEVKCMGKVTHLLPGGHVDYIPNNGLLGCCGACHKAGPGEELPTVQMDRMTLLSKAGAASRVNAEPGVVPELQERCIPWDSVHGQELFPGLPKDVPRGVEELLTYIEKDSKLKPTAKDVDPKACLDFAADESSGNGKERSNYWADLMFFGLFCRCEPTVAHF